MPIERTAKCPPCDRPVRLTEEELITKRGFVQSAVRAHALQACRKTGNVLTVKETWLDRSGKEFHASAATYEFTGESINRWKLKERHVVDSLEKPAEGFKFGR
jgi:hypothetical protein